MLRSWPLHFRTATIWSQLKILLLVFCSTLECFCSYYCHYFNLFPGFRYFSPFCVLNHSMCDPEIQNVLELYKLSFIGDCRVFMRASALVLPNFFHIGHSCWKWFISVLYMMTATKIFSLICWDSFNLDVLKCRLSWVGIPDTFYHIHFLSWWRCFANESV